MAERLEIVLVGDGSGGGAQAAGGGGAITSAATASGTAVRSPSVARIAGGVAAGNIVSQIVTGTVRAVASASPVGRLSAAAEQAAAFSPELATARAEADVSRTFRQIDRSERLGPGLARFERTRERINEKIFDLGTDILALLVKLFDALDPVLNQAIDFFQQVVDFYKNFDDGLIVIAEFIRENAPQIGFLASILEKLAAFLQKDVEKREGISIDEIVNDLKQQAPRFWGANTLRRRALTNPGVLP